MKPFYLFAVLLLLACNNNTENDKANAEKHIPDTTVSGNKKTVNKIGPLDLYEIKGFFTYSNIRKIDSTNTFSESACKRMTDEEYYSAFQTAAEGGYDPDYNGAYYYADQGDWHGFSRYIFVKKDESCCTFYSYHLYDQNGKETGYAVIGGDGGDGGWVINVDPEFLNDSTIKSTMVECEYGVDEPGKESGDCDSTITLYHLLPDGSIKTEKQASYKIVK